MSEKIKSILQSYNSFKLIKVADPWCLSILALYSIYYILRFFEPNKNYLQFNLIIPFIIILFCICFFIYLAFLLCDSSNHRAVLSALNSIIFFSSFSFLQTYIFGRIASWLHSPLTTIASCTPIYLVLGIVILVSGTWYALSNFRSRWKASFYSLALCSLVAWTLLYTNLCDYIPYTVKSEMISLGLCIFLALGVPVLLHYIPFNSKYSQKIIQTIVLVLSAMVLTVIVQILPWKKEAPQSNAHTNDYLQPAKTNTDDNKPDIVYILLDGMGREDSMRKSGINISRFSDDLRALGFFIPTKSMSSYMATDITLASVLNYDFASKLGIKSREQSRTYIKDNRLIHLLHANNYKTFSMSLFFFGKDIGATTIMEHQDTRRGEFISGLLNQTIYVALRPIVTKQFQFWYSIEDFHQFHTFTNNAIQCLRDGRYFRSQKPTFLFIHLLYAHVPFVFHPDGSFRLPEGGGAIESERSTPMANRISALQGQLDYLDKALVAAVRDCLKNRKHGRPIIFFLQGDHGPHCLDAEGKKTVFAAYYWPNLDYSMFRQDTTPVHASRVLIKKLFIPDLDAETVHDPSPSPEIRNFCPK